MWQLNIKVNTLQNHQYFKKPLRIPDMKVLCKMWTSATNSYAKSGKNYS